MRRPGCEPEPACTLSPNPTLPMPMKKSQNASMLHLTLHRGFFAQIAAGTKRTEFRERTDYWKVRLEGRIYDVVRFRNGYARNAPEMLVEYCGVRKIQRSGEPCYAIRLGRILKTKRWRP